MIDRLVRPRGGARCVLLTEMLLVLASVLLLLLLDVEGVLGFVSMMLLLCMSS